MKRASLVAISQVAAVELTIRRPTAMLHARLNLSRKRLDVCLLNEQGGIVQVPQTRRDADGLRGLAPPDRRLR
jgi:hypothetical protein